MSEDIQAGMLLFHRLKMSNYNDSGELSGNFIHCIKRKCQFTLAGHNHIFPVSFCILHHELPDELIFIRTHIKIYIYEDHLVNNIEKACK